MDNENDREYLKKLDEIDEANRQYDKNNKDPHSKLPETPEELDQQFQEWKGDEKVEEKSMVEDTTKTEKVYDQTRIVETYVPIRRYGRYIVQRDEKTKAIAIGLIIGVILISWIAMGPQFQPIVAAEEFGIEVRNGMDPGGDPMDLSWFNCSLYYATDPDDWSSFDLVYDVIRLDQITNEILDVIDLCVARYNGTSDTGMIFQNRWSEIFANRHNHLYVFPEPNYTSIVVCYENSTTATAPVNIPYNEIMDILIFTEPSSAWIPYYDFEMQEIVHVCIMVTFLNNVSQHDIIFFSYLDGFTIPWQIYNSTSATFEIFPITSQVQRYGIEANPESPSNPIIGMEVAIGSKVVAEW